MSIRYYSPFQLNMSALTTDQGRSGTRRMRSGSFCWWGTVARLARRYIRINIEHQRRPIYSFSFSPLCSIYSRMSLVELPKVLLTQCLRNHNPQAFQDESMVHDKFISDWKIRLCLWVHTLRLCWPAIRNEMGLFLHHRVCKSMFLKFGHMHWRN